MSQQEKGPNESDDPQVRAARINHRGIIITAAIGAVATVTASAITASVANSDKESANGSESAISTTPPSTAQTPPESAASTSPQKSVYLADLQRIGADEEDDDSWAITPVQVGATTYAKAISAKGVWCNKVQADYVVGGKFRRLQAKVGLAIDSEETLPLDFFVLADDKRIKAVGGVGIKTAEKIDISVEGVNRLAIGIEPSEGSSFTSPSCPGPERVGVWIDPRLTP